MPAVLRLNMTLPGIDPVRLSAMYSAALDMAEFAEANGFMAVTTDEHHGADDGWMPATLVFTGMLAARTKTIVVSVQALLLPLHDPLRVAEDLAVLDLASNGRVAVTLGLGYRPEEYAAHRKDWSQRGRLMDEAVEALLSAWTGEPFDYHGTRVRVTPVPRTKPHPPVTIGGSARPAARRAARFGLPFAKPASLPDLEAYYLAQCELHGHPGFVVSPPSDLTLVFVAEDPDRAWAEIGHHLLHEATTYADWQTPDIKSSVHSHARTVDDLRAEGLYEILSPRQCRDRHERPGSRCPRDLAPAVRRNARRMGMEVFAALRGRREGLVNCPSAIVVTRYYEPRASNCATRGTAMSFDQAKMWHAIEARLAATDNPRHRQMLEVVIEHAKAEADRSVERLMATLVDDPQYHFWVKARDVGPKGRDRVHDYYLAFATSGGAVFESPKDRIVVDDHNVVSEAEVKNYVPGSVAKARGYNVPDESGHYLVRFRNVVFFEFGDDPTRALGEDSYTQMDPDAWERVAEGDLPKSYVDYLAELAALTVVP